MSKGGKKQQKIRAAKSVPIIPGWIKAGLITGSLLVVVVVMNSLVSGVSLICYPVLLSAFLVNGILATFFEKGAYQIKKRLNPQTQRPSYLAVGAGAGIVVTLIVAVVYGLAASQMGSMLPPGLDLFGASPWTLIAIDSIAAIGLGLVGGLIGDQLL
jgi:hypothetical protein